jgi:PAP2 superfamily
MKKSVPYVILIAFLAFLLSNCSKEVISLTDEFEALDPLKPDTNAHNWKPILLTSADEFFIDAPLAVTSSDYLNELNEIRGLQVNATDEQRDLIKYWSAGAVLRWNEIVRELVAKYNLPPYQNDDGSYPIPSSSNPFAYPQFPFSNPPYAARAYAYISTVQYDALIAASFYQDKFRRESPSEIVSNIQLLVPTSQITGYAYPSTESTVEGATVEMLKLLFPTEIAYIQQKAYEHRLVRMLVGASTRSDLDAGEKLGKLVAGKFVARAKTDNAGKAVGDAAYWASLEQQAINNGQTPWISLESPKRPPMLPKFGQVKGFLIDSIGVINARPIAPPLTYSTTFQNDLEEVLYYSKNQTLSHTRIVQFWADGVGTYTPPGHWNSIASMEFVKERFSEFRWARNLALLNMSLMDAAICCWDAKYYYFTPRPSQMNSDIKTLTGLPNFPSYTSGHSTFSGAAATILSFIIPSKATKFNDYASEASISRLYGAIHYRRDCEAGLQIGSGIGQKAIERALIDGAQ